MSMNKQEVKEAANQAKIEAKKATKQAKIAEKELAKQAKIAEKELAKQAKIAEKEAAKQAKIAEKEAVKQSKIDEKEAAKQAKIAEKEAVKQAKIAEKEEEKLMKKLEPIRSRVAAVNSEVKVNNEGMVIVNEIDDDGNTNMITMNAKDFIKQEKERIKQQDKINAKKAKQAEKEMSKRIVVMEENGNGITLQHDTTNYKDSNVDKLPISAHLNIEKVKNYARRNIFELLSKLFN